MASLELKIKVNQDSIDFNFSGFNDSLFEFLSQALEMIGNFRNSNEDELREVFNQIKEKKMQKWRNFYLDQSYKQAAATLDSIILSPYFTKKQLRESLE
jgi:secreted Zn-dependent insulinase-like peptidase